MRLAAAAAPNPLSMFTTVTPDAHELSMASSAARPPKDAPYPTLVGTAITGTLTSPPTTLGNAPSIPATTMITAALRSASVCVRTRWIPATPTSVSRSTRLPSARAVTAASSATGRSEEHTSELQSHSDLVCRLLLEKKKKNETTETG